MGVQSHPLQFLFFPFMAPGHMNPMIDFAKLFTRHGVKATILTTPANLPLILPTIDRTNQCRSSHHHPIDIILIPFPSTEVGLPEGCENFYSVPSDHPDPYGTFLKAVHMLSQQFDQVLTDLAPHCVVADMFFVWTDAIAAKHGVPRLVFHGTSFFSLCTPNSFGEGKTPILDTESSNPSNQPDEHDDNSEEWTLPEIQSSKPSIQRFDSDGGFGVLVNSFYELEPNYAQEYKRRQEVVGGKAWHVGPASLCNEHDEDMCRRGGNSADCETCLQWLDSKAPGSVVYVCFGTLSDFTAEQLYEIAQGLNWSNRPFIWVVRDKYAHRLPVGYEKYFEGRGLIVEGWAPQMLILNNPAVGGFVTHCGWNSCLEAVSAGVPLVTWPLFADQFHNQKLMVEMLGVGVPVGATEDNKVTVEADEICKAVDELMDNSEEAETRKNKVRLLGTQARKAVREGGSSYDDIENLITGLADWWSTTHLPDRSPP